MSKVRKHGTNLTDHQAQEAHVDTLVLPAKEVCRVFKVQGAYKAYKAYVARRGTLALKGCRAKEVQLGFEAHRVLAGMLGKTVWMVSQERLALPVPLACHIQKMRCLIFKVTVSH